MMRPFGHRSCTQNTWNIIAGDYFWIHLQAKTKYLWDVTGLFDTTCSETTTKAVKQLMITKTWTSFTKHHQTVLFSVILPQLGVEGKNDLATRWHLWEALPASWGKHDFLESQDWLGKKQYQSNIVYKIWKHMIQLVHWPSASVISSQGIVQHPERDMHGQKRGITRWRSDKTKSYWANWVTLDDRTFHGNGNWTVRSVGIFLLVLVLPRGQVTYQWPGRIGSAWFSGSLDELIVNALVETAYRGCYITNPNNDVSICSCHTGVTLHYSEEST